MDPHPTDPPGSLSRQSPPGYLATCPPAWLGPPALSPQSSCSSGSRRRWPMADAPSGSLLLSQGSGATGWAAQGRGPGTLPCSGLDLQTPPGVPGAGKAHRHCDRDLKGLPCPRPQLSLVSRPRKSMAASPWSRELITHFQERAPHPFVGSAHKGQMWAGPSAARALGTAVLRGACRFLLLPGLSPSLAWSPSLPPHAQVQYDRSKRPQFKCWFCHLLAM